MSCSKELHHTPVKKVSCFRFHLHVDVFDQGRKDTSKGSEVISVLLQVPELGCGCALNFGCSDIKLTLIPGSLFLDVDHFRLYALGTRSGQLNCLLLGTRNVEIDLLFQFLHVFGQICVDLSKLGL